MAIEEDINKKDLEIGEYGFDIEDLVDFGGTLLSSGAMLLEGKRNIEFQKEIDRVQWSQFFYNSDRLNRQSLEALELGSQSIQDYAREAGQVLGGQRVATATGGLQVGAGTAGLAELQARETIAENINRLQLNSWKQAYGLKVDADFLRTQGKVTKLQSEKRAEVERANVRHRAGANLFSGLINLGTKFLFG